MRFFSYIKINITIFKKNVLKLIKTNLAINLIASLIKILMITIATEMAGPMTYLELLEYLLLLSSTIFIFNVFKNAIATTQPANKTKVIAFVIVLIYNFVLVLHFILF